MMKKQDMLQLLAYTGVAVVSVGLAFVISMKFLGVTRAQDAGAPPAEEAAQEPPGDAPPMEVPPPQEQAAPRAMPSGGGGGLAEIEGFLEPFIYDVVNRRDPFLAYAEFVPSEDGPTRPMSPAQRFAIEDLKLIGVLWDVKDPKALFNDPENSILTLGRDDSIGNRNGYIAAIREGEVVVVEAIRKRGDIIYRTKVLRIER